jgi:hypothetical protein
MPGGGATLFSSSETSYRPGAAILEAIMLSRKILVSALAAIAGVAMLVATSGPSSAFTLFSPSLEQLFAQGSIEPTWWDR